MELYVHGRCPFHTSAVSFYMSPLCQWTSHESCFFPATFANVQSAMNYKCHAEMFHLMSQTLKFAATAAPRIGRTEPFLMHRLMHHTLWTALHSRETISELLASSLVYGLDLLWFLSTCPTLLSHFPSRHATFRAFQGLVHYVIASHKTRQFSLSVHLWWLAIP